MKKLRITKRLRRLVAERKVRKLRIKIRRRYASCNPMLPLDIWEDEAELEFWKEKLIELNER